MGISDRGTKAKSITSCDNAFVTNIVLARDPGASNASEAALRTPQEALLCAKAKRQQQMFSVAKAKQQQQMFSVAKAKQQQQMFSVAKAKRQQQMFPVAKAKRQLQMFYLCESESVSTKRPVGTENNHTFW
ncbi:hypothetical protein LAV73_00520 [Lysinibacillus xylanilyticus]|uniref:hypothetical protein n=1 Tax=Lysinibacillus xylanilyticus TaxID=582475 RepID=UPI002B23F57F|nr:hypothetical protein [Lysinibacillus xylanilyticus]MEB2278488.1 hypothetical protein [Lysinibacillus xylanilyticus]